MYSIYCILYSVYIYIFSVHMYMYKYIHAHDVYFKYCSLAFFPTAEAAIWIRRFAQSGRDGFCDCATRGGGSDPPATLRYVATLRWPDFVRIHRGIHRGIHRVSLVVGEIVHPMEVPMHIILLCIYIYVYYTWKLWKSWQTHRCSCSML